METQYFIQVLILEAICVLILMFNEKSMFGNHHSRNSSYFFLWLFLTVFCTWFSWGGDYTTYKIYLEDASSSLEEIYVHLYHFLGRNYILWRFVVWGSSNLFVVLTLKKLQGDINLFYPLFIMLPLFAFYSVTRNVLGLSMMFYALATLDVSKRMSWIKTIILLGTSVIFHDSMYVFILIFILVLIIPFNKYTILAILAFLPAIKQSIADISKDVMTYLGYVEEETHLLSYLDQDNEMLISKIGFVHLVMTWLPVGLICIYALYERYIKNNRQDCNTRFLSYTFLLICLSFLFWGEASDHIRLRFWNTAYIPMCFFLVDFLKNRRDRPISRVFFVLIILLFIYRLLYNVYLML